MKFILIALTLLSSLALAADKHDGVCSEATKVCAVYHTDAPFTTSGESRFSLFLTASDQTEVTLVKADLWMQMGHHGHGSAPLKITPLAAGEFDVTNAYFVMKGTWQIRVTYQQGATRETLVIPVTVRE